ncbi:hypothetical protein Fmac_024915 [Flemingia macrophylla]|uniref:Uncharacterized protein n=1 Tax=Flemingia macrophylla TaxID=520843 RepID=A0ABD1LQR1_9FABA
MSILRHMLETSIEGHHSSRGQTLDREDGFQILAVSLQEMMPLSLEECTAWLQIHLLKLQKVEGNLDAPVNSVTQVAVNQKPASIVRVCGIRSSNYLNDNGIISCTETARNWKSSSLSSELEVIFSIKCLASVAVVAWYKSLQHKPQDAHSLQVATKKDRHLYGGHWKKGCHRLLQQGQASDSQLAESPSLQEHLACLPPF